MFYKKLKIFITALALAPTLSAHSAFKPLIFSTCYKDIPTKALSSQPFITAIAYNRSIDRFYIVYNRSNNFQGVSSGHCLFTSLVPSDAKEGDFVIEDNAGDANKFLPTQLMSLISGAPHDWLAALQEQTLSVFNGTTAAARQKLATNLKDASGATMAAVTATGGNRLATGTTTINSVSTGKAFAYVYASTTSPIVPGDTNDGICSANIDLETGAPTATTTTAGLGTAQKLNAVDGITAEGSYLGKADSAEAGTNGGWVNDLYWDQELQVLYAGVSTWLPQASGNISNGLVMTTLDATTGAVKTFNRADGTTGTNGPADNTPANSTLNVFSAKQESSSTWTNGASTIVRKICGMRTSTNFKYLILNATVGAGSANNINSLNTPVNTIYAVRVAATTGSPDSGVVAGQVVQKNQNNGVDVKLGDSWIANDLGATLVGGRPLLFDNEQAQFVTGMEVIGDAVYASIGIRAGSPGVRDANNDIGIFSSHALFDANGTIQGWTPWERAFACLSSQSISYAQLDAPSAFAVNGNQGTIFEITKNASNNPSQVKKTTYGFLPYGDGTPETEGILGRINNDVSDGCTAVLDLPTGTPGIGATNPSNSFTLFGSNRKVVFAQTKTGSANAVITDFSTDETYKLTQLPEGAGYVRSLGYSRNNTGTSNGYFFAGTNNGLYVYVGDTTTPAGFNGNNGMTDLTGIPFSGKTPGWIKMADPIITGAVIAIEANGNNLFVVEQQGGAVGGFTSKLHQFAVEETVTAMVNSAEVVAESGVGNIPQNAIFTGFTLVASIDDRNHNFGLLATNGGLFVSAQTVANKKEQFITWTAINTTQAYTLLKPIKRIPTGNGDGLALGATVSAFARADNDLWQKSSLFNTGFVFDASGDVTSGKILPYNNAPVASSPNLLGGTGKSYLEPIRQYWSDGGRRIGIGLGSQPYFTSEWNMTKPYDIMNNIGFTDIGMNNIFWIENISGLGVLMGGTNIGVVYLS